MITDIKDRDSSFSRTRLKMPRSPVDMSIIHHSPPSFDGATPGPLLRGSTRFEEPINPHREMRRLPLQAEEPASMPPTTTTH
jgi:hypothetical protein